MNENQRETEVIISIDSIRLEGALLVPDKAIGIVVFARIFDFLQ